MFRLYLYLDEDFSYRLIKPHNESQMADVRQWGMENGVTEATLDEMIYNLLDERPKRLFNVALAVNDKDLIIRLSHEMDFIHAKMLFT